MTFEVTNEKLQEVVFFPASEFEEIAQNVKTIITTIKGEVFLDRNFGVSGELLDAPLNILQAKMTAKICDAVAKFEPRAKVTDCIYSGDVSDGEALITVKFRIVEKNLRGGVGL